MSKSTDKDTVVDEDETSLNGREKVALLGHGGL